MRKELLVYVNSGEKDEEVAVRSVSSDRDLVILTNSVGKFTANRKELVDALLEIESFDLVNNAPNGNVLITEDISYEDTIWYFK